MIQNVLCVRRVRHLLSNTSYYTVFQMFMKFSIQLVNKTLYNKCRVYEKRLRDSRALL
jgi:hypothetical protein